MGLAGACGNLTLCITVTLPLGTNSLEVLINSETTLLKVSFASAGSSLSYSTSSICVSVTGNTFNELNTLSMVILYRDPSIALSIKDVEISQKTPCFFYFLVILIILRNYFLDSLCF